MLIKNMQESKFLQEFCSSSGMQKEKTRRLSIRPSGVRSAVTSNAFFFLLLFSIPELSTMTLGTHRAIYYRTTGVAYCTQALVQRRQCPCSLAAKSMGAWGDSKEGDKGLREAGQVVKALRTVWARKLTAISTPWCGLCSSLALPGEGWG